MLQKEIEPFSMNKQCKKCKENNRICSACIYHSHERICWNPQHFYFDAFYCWNDHIKPSSWNQPLIKRHECRSKARPYKVHFVCFNCRRGWKQYTSNYFTGGRLLDDLLDCDNTDLKCNPVKYIDKYCEDIRCAFCHNPSFVVNYNTEIPPKNNMKAWETWRDKVKTHDFIQ